MNVMVETYVRGDGECGMGGEGREREDVWGSIGGDEG